jgi:hypothetical protein
MKLASTGSTAPFIVIDATSIARDFTKFHAPDANQNRRREEACRLGREAGAPGSPDYVFAFHDQDEIGPRTLARIARATALKPDDL